MTEPEPFPEQVVGVLELITIDSITALASRLVAAPAASPVRVNPPGGEAPTVAALVAAAAEWGLESELSPVEVDRSNVSVSLPGGDGPGLLLLGHTDVVPLGDGWSVDPWAGLVREGRLYGRGAADMKGGLAACVIAMAAIRSAGIRLSGPIELAAVVDEEETGKGIRHYLSTVDRQGYVGCVVAEPTDLQTIIAARGDSYFRFTVTGRAAHSGQPSDGVNAIYGAARIVSDLEAWHGELGRNAHPLVGPATWSVGTIEGGSGTSTVPAECVVMADRRLLPGEDRDQVLAAVQDRIDRLGLADRGLTVRVEMIMDMPGFETPADHYFVTTSDRAITDAGGPSLDLGGWTAACDGGFLARDAGLPVVVLGPGSVATQAHQPDESVALADLLIAARAYALIALRTLLPSTSTVYQNEETLR